MLRAMLHMEYNTSLKALKLLQDARQLRTADI